jgi:5-methyltetrahydropteroyltriglutamate--homocysteine methyltransferase
MLRSTNRILTTHCGSLPRTTEVLAHLNAAAQGRPVDELAFDADVRAGVDDVVRRQVEAGVLVVNDGEMSKASFASYQMDRLGGFDVVEIEVAARQHTIDREARDYPEFFERWAFNRSTGATVGETPSTAMTTCCTGPITYPDTAAVEADIRRLVDAAAANNAADMFMSAVPPMGMGGGFGPNMYYDTQEDYDVAVSEAMRVEYEAIVAAGLVLQLDCNWGVLSRISDAPLDQVRSTIARHVELINHATRNISPEMMRIHLCWGADEAPHNRDLPLLAIIDLMLQLRPAGLGVVASNGRHEWEWRVWEDVEVPDGKIIIPGVIDTTTNIIEHPETVAERICRFAGVLGRENVIAGCDCGLDTIAGSAQVLPAIAWAKLTSLGQGAELASERLW